MTIVVFVLVGQSAIGQIVGAGGQIQQIPAAPVQATPVPALPIPPSPPLRPLAAGTAFPVKALTISGATLFSPALLIKVAKFQPGQQTLPKLQLMSELITRYYNQHGYFLARAYLPAQDITDGTVTVAVLEGRYGQIGFQNNTNVANVVLVGRLGGLRPGDPVQAAPLARRLLLISDLPGILVNSTLTPGSQVGTADLLVGVTQGPRVDGDVEADNWGNPYTGAYRVGGTVNWNEPFGRGDVLTLRTLEATDGGLDYVRISYERAVGDATVGAGLTGFKYRLGRQFESLNVNGWEAIANVDASYPLIRSYNDNLNLLADVDQRFFQDNIGAYSSSTNKRATVLIVGVSGDAIDTIGGGGRTDYSASVVGGDLTIETPAARAEDELNARTDGGYGKLCASISRLQNLVGPLSIYVAARGQVADKNLDVSEKMELGGATGVRAYPEGEAYGDDGYIVTVEPRLQLPMPARIPGQWQLIAFVDTGYVSVDHTPYGDARNGLTRSGAGVGLTWSGPHGLVVNVTYADLLGDNKATSYRDNGGELWFEVIKFF